MKAENTGTLGGEDGTHPLYSIEVKAAKRCVIEKWMEQCERNCPEDKIPLLRIHIANKNYDDDFIIVRAKHYGGE